MLEILNQVQTHCIYDLHFQNEKDFVIQNIVEKIKSQQGDIWLQNHIGLEFSDNQSGEFYNSFGLPFVWHFQPQVDFSDILSQPNFQGFVLSFHYLEGLHSAGKLQQFIADFYKSIKHDKPIQFFLLGEWNSDFFPSLFDYFQFDLVDVSIDSKIETCYRNVDQNELEKSIKFFEKTSPI